MKWLCHQLDWIKKHWQCASQPKKILMYLGVYTAIFLLTFLLAYSPFIYQKISFIWHPDGYYQHYPRLVYFARSIRKYIRSIFSGELTIPLFDLSLGLGRDMLNTFSSAGLTDPLMLIAVFFPSRYLEYLYGFLVVFRVYLSGISFLFLCHYLKKAKIHSLIGSIVYCFSGYALFSSVRHPYFITPMILLPLLIVGLDQVLQRKNPYLFIATVFYAALAGYYHLYMMTILLILYALVRFFDLYKAQRVKQFFMAFIRSAGAYIGGIGLSAVVFVPSVINFLSTSRAGFSNFSLGYSWPWYRTRLLRLIAPPGSWDCMSFAAIVLPALALVLCKRHKRSIKHLAGIAFLIYFTSIGGLVMNGFQYPSTRWTFALALLAAFVVVEMLPDLLQLSHEQLMLCSGVLIVYVIFVFSTTASRKTNYVLIGTFFLALTLFVLTIRLDALNSRENHQYIREILCLILVVFNVGINGMYLYAADQNNYIADFNERGYETECLEKRVERELEPYLLDQPAGRTDGSSFTMNMGMVWSIPGMLAYDSILPENIIDFWEAVENCGMYQEHSIASTGQQTIATTLLSEKYHVESASKTAYVPYGYTLHEETEQNNRIYENNYALPWGYTYDKTISYDGMKSLNGIQVQQLMLQAIMLNETESNLDTIVFDEMTLPYEISCKNCVWEDGILSVEKENAAITLTFDMPANVEGYIRVAGFDINGTGLTMTVLSVTCDDIKKTSKAYSREYTWYYGRKDFLFNLGWKETKRTSCTIIFQNKGKFKLDEIQIFALPLDHYTEQVNALREEPLENIQLSINRITGTINLSQDKILCMSIPYSKGWSAKVDGRTAEILCGNIMFMALPLEAGYHEIEFTYCTPGLKLGCILSLISLLIIIAMYIFEKKNKHIKNQWW